MNKLRKIVIGLLPLIPLTMNADEIELCDFENSPVITTEFGAICQIVNNDVKDGINTTDNCLQVGRTSTDWYALADVPVIYTQPANTVKYVHILIKYPAQPDFSIRVNDSGEDIRSITSGYSKFGQWQDLIFKIPASDADLDIYKIRILPDLGFSNLPVGQVLSESVFGYIDQIIISDSAVPRGDETITLNGILDFESKEYTELIADIQTQSADYVMDLYCENPDIDIVNPSQRCASFMSPVDLTNTSSWWHGFDMIFKKTVELSADRKYLHVMMKKDPVDDGTVQVSDGTIAFISAVLTNNWVDYVCELPVPLLGRLYFQFNSRANVHCYVDELWIDNDPMPRETIFVSVEKNTVDNISLTVARGELVINASMPDTVNIFGIDGRLVKSVKVTSGTVSIPLSPGLYLVNNTKVIIK